MLVRLVKVLTFSISPSAASPSGGDGTEGGDSTTNYVGGGANRTLSPEHLPKPGIVPETVSHFESEIDLTRDDQDSKGVCFAI